MNSILLMLLGLTYSSQQTLIINEIKKIELSVQIAQMMGADQAYRFSGEVAQKKGIQWEEIAKHPRFQKNIASIDLQNAKKVKEIYKQHGWPKISDYGKYTARNMWLLVQHMDHDVSFQEQVLKEMQDLLRENEVIKADYAYLKDRVLVNQKQEQIYGTQGDCKKEGGWEPKPITDINNLEKRRKEMDLPTMEEYKAMFKDICPKQTRP